MNVRQLRYSRGLVTALCACLAIGGIGVGQAYAAKSLTIRVWSIETSSRFVHNAPPKAIGTKGDVIAVTDRLANVSRQFGKPATAIIGTDKGTITFLGASKIKFVGSATLPTGTLRFAGTANQNHISVRIVGGTGDYRGASGTMTEPDAASDTNSKALNVYSIVLP
jgi:hypothetical protein